MTGVVLADCKLNILDRVPEHYFKNAAKFRDICCELTLEIIPTVVSFGNGSGILAHGPKLAEEPPARRPNDRFRELCNLDGIKPKSNSESGETEHWVLKDLRKACATYYDEHFPESSIEILGHSVGGITYRHYAHRAPLALRAIMTLPQPSAFRALGNGSDGGVRAVEGGSMTLPSRLTPHGSCPSTPIDAVGRIGKLNYKKLRASVRPAEANSEVAFAASVPSTDRIALQGASACRTDAANEIEFDDSGDPTDARKRLTRFGCPAVRKPRRASLRPPQRSHATNRQQATDDLNHAR